MLTGVTVDADAPSYVEGETTAFTFTLDQPAPQGFYLDLLLSGGPAGPTGYVLPISQGETTVHVDIPTTDNSTTGDSYTLNLAITGTSEPGGPAGPFDSASTSILDNDYSGSGGGSSGPSGPSGPTSLTLNPPADADEYTPFVLTGTISPPGYYSFGYSVTGNYGGFQYDPQTGNFSVMIRIDDDGPSPGNGTAYDIQTLTMSVWATETPGSTITQNTQVTIHNVAPIGDSELSIEGTQSFALTGWFSDVGGLDEHTITINWGDGSPIETFTQASPSYSFGHNYAFTGQNTFPIQITVTDGDLGTWTDSHTAVCALVESSIFIERKKPDGFFEEVPTNIELWADEMHRWTAEFGEIATEPTDYVTWYRLPWSQWLANPNFVANPLTQWFDFAAAPRDVPALATLPVDDWVITALLQTAHGFFLFADPRVAPANSIGQTSWAAGHPDQQFHVSSEPRVFPEKNSPTTPTYNQVKVHVNLEKPVADNHSFRVGLKALDPDHQHNPVNAKDTFDPNDSWNANGPIDVEPKDNRQATEDPLNPEAAPVFGERVGITPTTVYFDIVGDPNVPGDEIIGTTVFTIEDAQPGNNFIVVSGHRFDVIGASVSNTDGVTPLEPSATGPVGVPTSRSSGILTVMRTLWLELDSMREPDRSTEGPFDQPDILVNGQLVPDPEYDKFPGDVDDVVTNLIAPAFAVASIDVRIVAPETDVTDNLYFTHNVGADLVEAVTLSANVSDLAHENVNDFWVGHLIGAYEGRDTADRDNEPDALFGIARTSQNVAWVFHETIRDYTAGPDWPTHVGEDKTLERVPLHETRHFFGLRDMLTARDPWSVMNYDTMNYRGDEYMRFTYSQLGRIQYQPKPIANDASPPQAPQPPSP